MNRFPDLKCWMILVFKLVLKLPLPVLMLQEIGWIFKDSRAYDVPLDEIGKISP